MPPRPAEQTGGTLRLLLTCALALSCTASPSVAAPSASPTASAARTPSATPSPSFGDLTIAAAGDIRGDHALVLQVLDSQTSGGISQARIPPQPRIWDVPLDGSPPRLLVGYTQAPQVFTDYDSFDLARQLSPDGQRLVLTDAADIAGTGLLVIDLVTGTARKIDIASGASQPAWSPDGKQIAYRGFAVAGPLQKGTGLWTVSASGGPPRLVWAGDGSAAGGPGWVHGWTADGTGIAISPNFSEVGVVDVLTGKLTRIPGTSHGIAWRTKRPSVAILLDDEVSTPTPSGARGAPGSIAHPGRLEVRDATFSAGRIAARYGADVGTLLWGPRWNPTSDEVLMFWVCGAGATERDELVIVDAVSSARRALPTPGCVRSVAWNADGTTILYSLFESVRVRNVDGSNDRELFRPALPPGTSQQHVGAVTAFGPH